MRSNIFVIIGMALLLSFIPQFVAGQATNINVMADVAGEGNVQIGTIAVTVEAGSGLNATFTFAADYAGSGEDLDLDDWYDFRWVNVETGYTITGPVGVCCDNIDATPLPPCGVPLATDPVVGTLPAIDPAPGTLPLPPGGFNDPSPFYFTDDEHAACVVGGIVICDPGVSSHFRDARMDGACISTINFSTFLVAKNKTDDTPGAMGATEFCLLAGFTWTATNHPTLPNTQAIGAALNPIASSLPLLNGTPAAPGPPPIPAEPGALENASPPGFPDWSAVSGCTFTSCVAIPPPAIPPNDDCPDGSSLFEGFTPFDTTFASTDGIPLLDSVCDMGPFGDEQIHNDIWYRYTATADGPVLVSTCGLADFDTRLAIYEDFGCPADPLVVVACNDDGPGCPEFTSELVFDAEAGADYLIRLGSFASDFTGTGEILVSGPTTVANFKRGDTNGDGTCDIGDAVSLLGFLFTGGTCACLDACDVNDDGGFPDIADVIFKLTYLFNAGSAPPDPGPEICGPDQTDDSLGCEVSPCP
ncbi:MAG: hypothetical protein CMJ95_14560 [Planctomycetes bacterium]|nr:hypothetical protein [Planctomycetota bacterium]MAW78587.1 hypothetical protein [Planctomycetota bacterium]